MGKESPRDRTGKRVPAVVRDVEDVGQKLGREGGKMIDLESRGSA